LRPLEGVPVKLSRHTRVVRSVTRRAAVRTATVSYPAGVRTARAIATTVLVVLALLLWVSPALASEAQKIIEKCAHAEPFSGYSHKAYREALKQLPTEVSEYSSCPNLIRKAELTAEGGGGGGATAPGASPTVALPLTPVEQRAVQRAHHHGSTPVQVAGEPIRPGVVHADIASAVSTLPDSLLAVLALMLAGVVALATREAVKRVRARHDG
jgi:hypothetical protein